MASPQQPKYVKFRRFLYAAYRGGSRRQRASRWGAWRFTPAGRVLGLTLLVSAFIGMDTTRTVVFRGFTLLFGVMLLSALFSKFFRVPFRVARELPRFGTVGQSLEYTLTVHNPSKRFQKNMTVREVLETARPSRDEFVSTPEPGEEQRNIYDRTLLVYRWHWLIVMKQGARVKEQLVPPIPPQDSVQFRVTLLPVRRGYVRLAGITLLRPDPFNLYKGLVYLPVETSILILPKRYELPSIMLPGARKFKAGGVTLASSVGDSEEFMSLRDYRPGDPLRHIHWRSWAKIGKPIVKEFQAEYFVRHALVLDTFQQQEYSARFEAAVSLASSFACTVRTQESLLDVLFVGPEAYSFTVGRGVGNTEQMLEILACVQACRDKEFHELTPLLLERASILSGTICIFLDWDEARQELVRTMQAFDVPMLVFVIVDDAEARAGVLHALETNAPHGLSDAVHVLTAGHLAEELQEL